LVGWLFLLFPTFGSLVQQRGHAEDVLAADVGHGHLDHGLAVLQAAVALEGVPGIAGERAATLGAREHVHVLAVRHQDDLEVTTTGSSHNS